MCFCLCAGIQQRVVFVQFSCCRATQQLGKVCKGCIQSTRHWGQNMISMSIACIELCSGLHGIWCCNHSGFSCSDSCHRRIVACLLSVLGQDVGNSSFVNTKAMYNVSALICVVWIVCFHQPCWCSLWYWLVAACKLASAKCS